MLLYVYVYILALQRMEYLKCCRHLVFHLLTWQEIWIWNFQDQLDSVISQIAAWCTPVLILCRYARVCPSYQPKYKPFINAIAPYLKKIVLIFIHVGYIFVKSARFVMIWVVYLVPYIVICFWITNLKWTELSFLGNHQICYKSVKILFKIEKVL